METTPVTATTAAELYDQYVDHLVHITDSHTANEMTETAWSQELTYHGQVYAHRRITDLSDGSTERQWFRVG